MVGDDACSVCASLIQKLLEFIANMEHNKQYRKGMKPPKTPKIKTGKLSKKCLLMFNMSPYSYGCTKDDIIALYPEANVDESEGEETETPESEVTE